MATYQDFRDMKITSVLGNLARARKYRMLGRVALAQMYLSFAAEARRSIAAANRETRPA